MSDPGRAVVTGGAGFLGSHLCDRLVADGWAVLCVDSLITGRRANIAHLEGHPRFAFLQADVTRPLEVEGAVDLVLHFASPASPRDYAQLPIHTLKAGGLGTYHALGLARAKGAAFVLASSSEVYGDPQVTPQPEDYWGHVNPVGPRSVYDEAKRYAEALAAAYARTHGLRVAIARIFNTYGPRMRADDGRALPTFITQALQGLPLTVFGDGSQTRSFCYVDDLIEGVLRLARFAQNHDGTPTVVNLGNPEETTILAVAQEILALTASRSPITFHPLPADDPRVRRPDITRAEALLGWTATVSRTDGLRMTIEHFRARPAEPAAKEAL
ncbi:MAG: SDR family oxidoreductase [Armatimonadota bacterium]|nr:SDR family oxidoreductase [Armatimonadota bacterium]